MTSHALPIALTIAGSDSGGGAGIQADLKTFAALGTHGTSVITCITAQNPRRVIAVQPIRPAIVKAQIEAVLEALPPAAAKTGMLYDAPIIRAVAEQWRAHCAGSPGHRRPPLVVDPVMVATSGAALLKPSAVAALTRLLFPLAAIITPNLDEAATLLGRRPRSTEEMRAAARRLHDRFSCAVLLKGGHLHRSPKAVDIFWDGADELILSAPFIRGVSTHGTGCTYAAAITAGLARGLDLAAAVAAAKDFLTHAIRTSRRIGRRHFVLNTTGI